MILFQYITNQAGVLINRVIKLKKTTMFASCNHLNCYPQISKNLAKWVLEVEKEMTLYDTFSYQVTNISIVPWL